MPENSESGKLSRWPEVVLVCIVVLLIFVSVFAKRRYVIGMVNVDRVAESCGADKVIAESFRQWDVQANARLQARQEQYKANTAALAAKLKNESAEAVRSQIQLELRQLRKAYELDIFTIQTDRQRFRIERLRGFRFWLRPLAAEVAKQRHVEIVFADGEHVLACAQGVDLTSEVADLAAERFPSAEDAFSPLGLTSDVPTLVEPSTAGETSSPPTPATAPETP